jgi:heme a synthase
LTGCVLIFAMVIIGGITRLTQSGLSIVEWNLFTGVVPPTNQQSWQILFEKYQQSPQYELINSEFSIDQFKSIFWWEYIHRLLGRVIGVVFAIPFLYFLIRKKLSPSLLKKLLFVFVLGGFQGFLGWYMVKSGLVQNPFVSHYRLAAHLLTAFASFGFTFWVALGLMYPNHQRGVSDKSLSALRTLIYIVFGLSILQITYGAFVAGLHAGKMYNTFPLMGDSLMPASVHQLRPFWKNLLENHAGVQFIHRNLAYLIVILIGVIFYLSRKVKMGKQLRSGLNFLSIFILVQFSLGVLTLLYMVPINLAVMHQAGAFVLLSILIYMVFHMNRNTPLVRD